MIVCADDYGLRADIDEAILELVRLRKLSAVSCMVVFERCSPDSLRHLAHFRDRLDLGLHLCLTAETPPLSPRAGSEPLIFRSYANCLQRSFRGKIRHQDLLAEIAAQYELFQTKAGAPPDYIDGHLHIHQAPAVRKALIEFVLALPEKARPYIRNTRMNLRRLKQQKLPRFKAAVVSRFGSRMAGHLRAAGLRTNDGFAGIYDFRRCRSFPEYLPRFVNCLDQPTGILVVHPGGEDDWRRTEFETLRNFTPTKPLNRFANSFPDQTRSKSM